MKYPTDKISTYFKQNKPIVIAIAIFGLFFDGLMCLVPIIQGYIITKFAAGVPFKEIYWLILLMFSFILFVQINRYFKRYFVRLFSNKMTLSMRKTSYQNLLKQDMKIFEFSTKGDIMNKNLADIMDTSEGIRKVTTEIFDSIVLLIGYLISMIIMDLQITLIAIVFISISIMSAAIIKKQVVNSVLDYKKYFSYSKQVTLNSLDNELNYRSLGVRDNYDRKYIETQDILEKKAIKASIFQGSMEPIYSVIALLGIIFVIFFGVKNVLNDIWEVGNFTAYLTTYLLVATKASKIGKVFNAYQKAKVSWVRCKPFLQMVEDTSNIEIVENSFLKVSNLTFYFDKNCRINELSFEAKQGEIIGVSGMVHTGKSTLMAALTGLYNYEGSINLCGYELKDIKLLGLQNFITYLPSEVEVFNKSIIENITLGNPGDYLEASYNALFDGDVRDFAKNYETVISHSLTNLSGGQQKRLGIARCIFNHPKLVVLDDPFNAIGKDMSSKIVNNLKSNYHNTIFIIVTNQQNVLSHANQVIFLMPNDKYEINNYQYLMDNNEKFKDMMKGSD